MVTGGYGSTRLDSTEVFSDSSWRTVTGKLPDPMIGIRVTTVNNGVLLFGNLLFWIECIVVNCTSSGGSIRGSIQNTILEFNYETESWTEVGTMKRPRRYHAVSVVPFDDFANWCNYPEGNRQGRIYSVFHGIGNQEQGCCELVLGFQKAQGASL